MSTTQHTPGPWEAQLEHGGHASFIDAHDGVSICAVSFQDPQMDGGRSYETEHANAKLLAAAPDLQQSVYGLLYVIKDLYRLELNPAYLRDQVAIKIIDQASAAIAKAKV